MTQAMFIGGLMHHLPQDINYKANFKKTEAEYNQLNRGRDSWCS
jgi:hypothetical protein